MDDYIEQVYGIQSTNISMHDRFTLLKSVQPAKVYRQRRPQTDSLNWGLNVRHRLLIEQIARRIERQANLRAFRQRIGRPHQVSYQQFNGFRGMQRSNSFGNLRQVGYQNRNNWRASNGNLSRSASLSNLSGIRGRRGLRRRGGNRANFRNYQNRFLRPVGRGRGRGGARGRGRGALSREQPTREELDQQLEQYMSGTKAALDRQLDDYMQEAVVMEE